MTGYRRCLYYTHKSVFHRRSSDFGNHQFVIINHVYNRKNLFTIHQAMKAIVYPLAYILFLAIKC